MTPVRCADASRAAGEELPGTGIVAARWLCVESTRSWEHDAVASGFPGEVAAWLGQLDVKVFAIRRPGRRSGVTAFAAEVSEGGSVLRRLELGDVSELGGLDPWVDGEPVHDPLLLVCTHGRRDACCSRLGIPVFHALEAVAGPDLVWQCSHTGGHRFAANVVGLPLGVTLGRVEAHDAPEIVARLREGRVPLERYRGRSLYSPPEQAAEVAVRQRRGIDGIDDLRIVARVGPRISFETASGERIEATVAEVSGPEIPKSCGAEPEPTVAYAVDLA